MYMKTYIALLRPSSKMQCVVKISMKNPEILQNTRLKVGASFTIVRNSVSSRMQRSGYINNKYHTIGIVTKSNRKIVQKEAK